DLFGPDTSWGLALPICIMGQPVGVLLCNITLCRNGIGCDPDARLQPQLANFSRQPFHAVGVELIAFPVPKRPLIAVVNLNPLHAVRFQILGNKLSVLQLLLFSSLGVSVEPGAPAVDDRIELYPVQATVSFGVIFQSRE